MSRIELSTYIEALRDELQRCITMSEGQDLRFGTDKIDLEIEVAVETEVGAKAQAKFKFFVVDASAAGDIKTSTSQKQKLKLSLAPVYKGKIGSFMISGQTSSPDKS